MKKTLLPLVACLALLVLAGGIGNLGSNAPPPAAAVMDSAAQSEQKPQEFMVGQTDSLPEMAQENPPVDAPAQASGNSTGSGEITPRTATPEPQKPVTTASPPPAPPVSSVPPPATDTLVKGERPPANVALVAAPLPYFAVLTLTQEMTADFLSAYTGVTSVRATEGEIEQIETKYELTAAQFDTLLAQLSPLPEGATLENRDESALLALVLVTGSRPKTN